MGIKRYIKLIAASSLVAGFLAVAGPALRASASAVACPSNPVTSASSITTSGTTANVTFTIAPGCHDIQLSFVSYTAPSNTFDPNTASQQVVFDSITNDFDSGTHTLSINIPNCFFQADLVYGTVITQLGPAGSNNFYGVQGRLITGLNSGSQACGGMGGGETNVTLCHATDSTTNPYVRITVDVDGAYHGHFLQHQGPVFGPGVTKWGDIIPPFVFNDQTFSLNWTTAGQAIFNNNCMPVGGQGGGQMDCDGNFDNSPASECTTPQKDCDNDTDNSPATECNTTTGGQGGGSTTTTTTGQVLGATTTAGSGAAQVAVVPQGSVNGGEGAASKALDRPSLVGLMGALLSLGSGLAMLNRRQN